MYNTLLGIASGLELSKPEKELIEKDIATLIVQFNKWSRHNLVKEIKIFGSYARKTILSRKHDPDSDVDVMIIFKDAFNTTKETYYDILHDFAKKNYGKCIVKDEPSIVLNRSGINIELTPGVEKGASINLQIPTVNNQFLDWTWTDPFELIKEVEFYDTKIYDGRLRQLIRLFKFWNVSTGHHYPSYKLEYYLTRLSYIHMDFFEMFCHAVTHLPTHDSEEPEKVLIFKAQIGFIKDLLRDNKKSEAVSVLDSIFHFH